MVRRLWGRKEREAEQTRPLYSDSFEFISDFRHELKTRKEEMNKKLKKIEKIKEEKK